MLYSPTQHLAHPPVLKPTTSSYYTPMPPPSPASLAQTEAPPSASVRGVDSPDILTPGSVVSAMEVWGSAHHAPAPSSDLVSPEVLRSSSSYSSRFLSGFSYGKSLSPLLSAGEGIFSKARTPFSPFSYYSPELEVPPVPIPALDADVVGKDTAFHAVRGGLSGAAAMGVQVCSLMWLRTTMNYQYRYGTSFSESLRILYKSGGIRRFYRGAFPALLQGPLCRFGDTAANVGVLSIMDASPTTKDLPLWMKTLCASAGAAGWRFILMPLDTLKIIAQVQGFEARTCLKQKIRDGGLKVLFHGTLAASGAALLGHFFWFTTYNSLNSYIPEKKDDPLSRQIMRSGFMGFVSSAVSDCCSNFMYIIKINKQASEKPISYLRAAEDVIRKDGYRGLFGRGLATRMIGNGIQGLVFSISWKLIDSSSFWN